MMTIDDVMKAAHHAADAQEGWNADDKAWDTLREAILQFADEAVCEHIKSD